MMSGKSLTWILLGVLSFRVLPEVRCDEIGHQPTPLIAMNTAKSMEQALTDLKQALINHNYVFIRQQSIDSRLTKASLENSGVILVYFCNFNMLDRALNTDRRVGVFLPCKITLIQKDGHIKMVAVNPIFISKLLGNESLNTICDRLARDYHRILEEAVL